MSASSQRTTVSNRVMSHAETLEDADVLFIGSLRAAAVQAYDPTLSDIDILIVPKSDSLDDYVSHFNRAMKIATDLNGSPDGLADVFLISHSIARAHYSCLSIYAGCREVQFEDFILDNGIIGSRFDRPDPLFKKKLYAAYSECLIGTHKTNMPIVDTRFAKRTAKRLLRLVKMVICAHEDSVAVNNTEAVLFDLRSFSEVLPILKDKTGILCEFEGALDSALRGNPVEDWPLFVQEQIGLIRALGGVDFKDFISEAERFVYTDLSFALRSLLLVGVKDLVSGRDAALRTSSMEQYVNDAISVVVRLATAGVENLMDLAGDDKPRLVRESYAVLRDFLQGGNITYYHWAAATVLLEYAFDQSYEYCHRAL